MKVTYENGTRFKWVAPHEMEEVVRESKRPKPPEPMVGEMLKEEHYFFLSLWQKFYVELQKGHLQWWWSQSDAQLGKPAYGSVYVLGLQQHSDAGNFKVRSESSEGAVFHFRADSEETCAAWVDGLWAHAGFCEENAEYFEAKLEGFMVRKELMSVMMRREFMSVTEARASRVMKHPLIPPEGEDED